MTTIQHAAERASDHLAEDTAPVRPWLQSYPSDVAWDAPLQGVPLHSFLDNAASQFPDRMATLFLGGSLTYGELGALCDRAAKGLQELGVKKGDHVGLLLPNSPTYLVFYYAILKIGGVVVNYNPLYTANELEYQAKDSQTDLIVTLDLKLTFDKVDELLTRGSLKRAVVCDFAALLPGLKSTLFKLFKSGDRAKPTRSENRAKLVFEKDLMANDGTPVVPTIDPESDLAVIQYTGGTTGKPKGAMLTHANLSINVQQLSLWGPHLKDGQERGFAALPFFHVFAMTTILNFGVAKAAEMVIMPRFQVDDGLKLIHKTRPTFMPGVPTLYNAIMNHPKLGDYDLTCLDLCISGGAPLPLDLKRSFEAKTGCSLVEGYGLSETSPVATCNPLQGPTKEGSIGQPMPGTTIEIREIGNPEKVLPQGEKGEICISGPQVMRGYWQRPDATADTFVGNALRTGDVGYIDEEGFTFIVDRMKDLIICSGYNVYPRNIEEAIYEHPDVEEVTVIGIADKYRGEAPKAFIKLRGDATMTQDEMISFLSANLSKIEMPEAIEFRDELPKTMIGKLSKQELKEEEAAKAAQSA